MAQDGSHGHQDTASSDEHSLVPPTTTTFVLDPTENDNGRGSRIGRSKGKNSAAAAIAAANALAAGELKAQIKARLKARLIVEQERRRMEELFNTLRELMPHVPKTVDKATLVGDAIDYIRSQQNTKAAVGDGNLKMNIIIERERRWKMKGMLNTLRDLMPHVDKEVDQVTLLDETIKYLQQIKANLENKKQDQELARQAAASSMAAAGAGPLEFQTRSAPNVVLSVLPNDEAVINIRAPERPHMLTLLMSVLSKYNIEVTSMHVVLAHTTEITINARVNGAIGQNPSAEGIYKLAVSEIMVRLSS